MANFYNQGQSSNGGGGGGGGGGFYNSGGGYGQPQFGQSTQQQAPSNFNQWQQPTATSQQGMNTNTSQQQSSSSQQQQQQQQGQSSSQQTPAFWTPDANSVQNQAANMLGGVMAKAATGGLTNEAILGAVFEGGREVWVSGGARMIPGLETGVQRLRSYFAVDNRYVKRKMQKVLFPFLNKQWRRTVRLVHLLLSCRFPVAC
jgi:hypothetical protein